MANKPMTKDEWLGWIKQTWDAAQKAAWAEKPPQREWVGLTDEEIKYLDMETSGTVHDFVRAIEAKLKERNHD